MEVHRYRTASTGGERGRQALAGGQEGGSERGQHHFYVEHRGKYKPNSTSDGNLRRLETTLPAAVAASSHLSVQITVVGGLVARGTIGLILLLPRRHEQLLSSAWRSIGERPGHKFDHRRLQAAFLCLICD
ncbi:hypothetical protein ACP70R_004467 [Stipagrostis hirtigluma subsp. patula]